MQIQISTRDFCDFVDGIKTFRGENQINPDLSSEGHTNSAVVK